MGKTIGWVARISATWIAMVTASMAQSPAPCATPVALGAMTYGAVPKVGAPYSATVKTTHEQKLADGTSIYSTVTNHQARDAAGRTWEARSLGCQAGPDGERHPVMQEMEYDPGTRTTISWRVDDPAKVLRSIPTPSAGLPSPKEDKAQDVAARRPWR